VVSLGAQEAALGEGLRQSTNEQRETLFFPNFKQGVQVRGTVLVCVN